MNDTGNKIKFHRPRKLLETGLSLDFNKFGENLSKADYALGVLEGSQKNLKNPTLLISPLTAKEATASSSIEGTQSTVADVFFYEAGGKPKYSDTVEVTNYREAMTSAIDEIKEGKTLSLHLIKALHQVLLNNARHKGIPGKVRQGEVWIGKKYGDPIEKAIYIPPEPFLVDEYLENLVGYIQKSPERPLIKAGIVHYQFEAIHPFDDGNGRIGRLLIPLILFERHKISSPILYMSGYFEAHRDEYIDALHRVDKDGNYETWLNFFLGCVSEQVTETQKIVESIFGLYDEMRSELCATKSPYMIPFIDFIFKYPIFSLAKIREVLNCSSWVTSKNLVKELQKRGKIIEARPDGNAKLYGFIPLLNIFKIALGKIKRKTMYRSVNGLTPKENKILGRLTKAIFIIAGMAISYKIWGQNMFVEFWFYFIEGVSYGLAWILLRLTGIWKY